MGALLSCLARLLLSRQRQGLERRGETRGANRRGVITQKNPVAENRMDSEAGHGTELHNMGQGREEKQLGGEVEAGSDPAVLVGQSNPVRLVHQTRVNVKGGVARMRVFHALAKDEVWAVSREGPLNVSIRPDGERDGDDYVHWDISSPEAGTYMFETSFVCEAAGRWVVNADAVPWALHAEEEAMEDGIGSGPRAQVADDIQAEMDALARGLRTGTTGPGEFVRRLARWLAQETVYDTSVDFGVEDVGSFWRTRHGWCGHRAKLFAEVCRMAGLPCRHAWGYCVGGEESGHSTAANATAKARRADRGRRDGNRHTWAEVHLSGLGWVEVEPVSVENPFHVPASYIPCPRELQCVGVWHMPAEAGGESQQQQQSAPVPPNRPNDHEEWRLNALSYEDVVAFGRP